MPKNQAQHCLFKRGCQLAFLETRGISPLGPSSRPPPPTPEIWIGGTGRLLPPCRRPPPLSSSLAPALRLLPAVPALLRSPAPAPPALARPRPLPAAPAGGCCPPSPTCCARREPRRSSHPPCCARREALLALSSSLLQKPGCPSSGTAHLTRSRL